MPTECLPDLSGFARVDNHDVVAPFDGSLAGLVKMVTASASERLLLVSWVFEGDEQASCVPPGRLLAKLGCDRELCTVELRRSTELRERCGACLNGCQLHDNAESGAPPRKACASGLWSPRASPVRISPLAGDQPVAHQSSLPAVT